jgi:heavy metal sensor kinase
MADKAKEITAERLEERLPVTNPDDEIGRMAAVFNETLGRLHASFENLRRFTSDASHELRTPLTVIRTVGEVSLQKPLSAGEYRDVIGSMLEEAERLALLVENLLTLTRADHGRSSMKREPVSIDSLVKEAVDDLSVLAEEKKQILSLETTSAMEISADRSFLRQALINLTDNAIKYTPEKGRIQVKTGTQGRSEAVIEVVDNGMGISREHIGQIFERFYRVDKGRSRETGGTGLGLSIARQAVEANGGRIEVESSKDRGSTFRIVIPLKDDEKVKR